MKRVEIPKPQEYLDLVESKQHDYLYHDHPNDGIDLFTDDELEKIGWFAITFDFISYRDIAQFIEENCEGTLTYNDHPLGFNGFVEVDNMEDVREQVKQFVIDTIKKNSLDKYDDDQIEALEFFGINI